MAKKNALIPKSKAKTARERHGLSKSPTFRSWRHMRDRCLNPNTDCFANYGGRGISVCPRWDSFTAFLADMGERPTAGTLDRIDNNGNYEPANCRWATRKEQANNRRITDKMRGKFFTSESARKAGIIGGRLGGLSRSPAKVAAARRNGGAMEVCQ